MASKTLVEKFRENPRLNRLLLQETAVLNFTELVCGLLKKRRMSRLQLARKIGLDRKQLDAMLNGEEDAPITLKQAADMLWALGALELDFVVK